MEIITKRLRLLPCKEELLSDDIIIEDHIHYYLHEIESDPSLIGWGVWLVFRKDDGQLLGDIGFKGKPREGVVEIGYGILKEAQNNGYASEAVEALIDWAFNTKKVEKITAECLRENISSMRVLEKVLMMKTHQDEDIAYWEKNILQ